MKRKKPKPRRSQKIADLLKELPEEPSAMTARWDASCSSDDYIRRASNAIAQTKTRLSLFQEVGLAENFKAERYNVEASEKLVHEAKFQLLGPRYGLRNLLDRENWAIERPSISLHATINQRGNFAVTWSSPAPDLLLTGDLLNATGLKDQFFGECWYRREEYGGTRPPAELLRFRHVPLQYCADGSDHPATRYVIYALRCRFDAIVGEVTNAMNVIAMPTMKFSRDDDAGLELSLS